MKAITLRQPFASLVAAGQKRVATQHWQTSYRGPLAIHAAKEFPLWARNLCHDQRFTEALCPAMSPRSQKAWARTFPSPGAWLVNNLPTGCIVAVCDLGDIASTETVYCNADDNAKDRVLISGEWYIPRKEWEFGDYSLGRYAWILDNVRALPEPIPARGVSGLWEWEADN